MQESTISVYQNIANTIIIQVKEPA